MFRHSIVDNGLNVHFRITSCIGTEVWLFFDHAILMPLLVSEELLSVEKFRVYMKQGTLVGQMFKRWLEQVLGQPDV